MKNLSSNIKIAWIGLLSAVLVALINILPDLADKLCKKKGVLIEQLLPEENQYLPKDSVQYKDQPVSNNGNIQKRNNSNQSLNQTYIQSNEEEQNVLICFIESATDQKIIGANLITPYSGLNHKTDKNGCLSIPLELSKKIGIYNLIEGKLHYGNKIGHCNFGLSESQNIFVSFNKE